MPKKAFLTFSLIAVSVVVYFLFGYVVMREQTVFLLSLYAIVFAVYFIVLKKAETETINSWLITAFVFRVVFIFSVPGLSDDIFRFLWDGKLLANGFSPYAFLPSDMVELQPEWSSLYYLLNSKNYHSIYPPFAQLIFWLSAVIAPDSITFGAVVIRILVIAAEFGSILLMIRLLKAWGVNKRNVLLYALNPLVIVELTGNLHFEVFVIFFVLLSFYLLTVNRSIAAGCAMGLAIAAKLIPLILLPMFLVRLSLKKNILFYGGCVLVTIALFYPFFSTLDITGFYDSFLLYFKKFEFNASIYYLVREYGYWDKGYNIIQTAGWKLGTCAALAILLISWWPFQSLRNLKFRTLSIEETPAIGMFALFMYLLFATTVHPWYITPIVALCAFTGYRFAIVWSLLIFFSYAGYTRYGYTENLWIVMLEYVIVIGWFIKEITDRRMKSVAQS